MLKLKKKKLFFSNFKDFLILLKMLSMLNFPDISVFFNQILGVEVFFATLNKGTINFKVSIELPHTQRNKGSRGILKY